MGSGRISGLIRAGAQRIANPTVTRAFHNAATGNSDAALLTNANNSPQPRPAQQNVTARLTGYQSNTAQSAVVQARQFSTTAQVYAADRFTETEATANIETTSNTEVTSLDTSSIEMQASNIKAKALIDSIKDAQSGIKAFDFIKDDQLGKNVDFRLEVMQEARDHIEQNLQTISQAIENVEQVKNDGGNVQDAEMTAQVVQDKLEILNSILSDLHNVIAEITKEGLRNLLTNNSLEAVNSPKEMAKAIVPLIKGRASMQRQALLLQKYEQFISKDDAKALRKELRKEARSHLQEKIMQLGQLRRGVRDKQLDPDKQRVMTFMNDFNALAAQARAINQFWRALAN